MEAYVFYASVVSIGIVCGLCYKALRHYRYRYSDKIVNCWFCNEDSKVHYNRENSWKCCYCEQYNGFDKDGGYNRIIPEQFSEELNPLYSHEAEEYLPPTTTFCENCQRNQQMKIGQLAAFQPLREENYDIEMERFKDRLELIYKLCHNCQKKLESELNGQNRILAEKMSLLKSCQSASSYEPYKTPKLITEESSMIASRQTFKNYLRSSVLLFLALLFYVGLHIWQLIPTFLVLCFILSRFSIKKIIRQSQDPSESRTITSAVSFSKEEPVEINNDIDVLDSGQCSSGLYHKITNINKYRDISSTETSSRLGPVNAIGNDALDYRPKVNGSKNSEIFSIPGSTPQKSCKPSAVTLKRPLISPSSLHVKSTGTGKPSVDVRSDMFSLFTKTEKYNAYSHKEKLPMYNKWQSLKKSTCMGFGGWHKPGYPFLKTNTLSFAKLKQFATPTDLTPPYNSVTTKTECMARNGSHRQCESFSKTKRVSFINPNLHVKSTGTQELSSGQSEGFTSFTNTEKYNTYGCREKISSNNGINSVSKTKLIFKQALDSKADKNMQKQTGCHRQNQSFCRWRGSDVHSH